MSRVFLAEETRFHRKVVIKVLAPELAAGISADRFEREITLAAGLQQANIVPVLTAGDIDGLPYFTMPFVDGESLRSRLASATPLPLSDCVSILRDVTRALGYAHEHGVVHRDIKPENVLLAWSRRSHRLWHREGDRRSPRQNVERDAHAIGDVYRHTHVHVTRAGRR